MFRRREGRGSDRNNETRVVKNLTDNPVTLGDIDNFEIPAKQTRDLLKFASIQRIGNSVDLKTAVELGLLQLRDRRNRVVPRNDVYDNIIPAVLQDTREIVRIATVSSDYTALPDDDLILVSETATITLPSAAGIEGRIIVKNIGSGAIVTIASPGDETIDGDDAHIITVQYNSLPFVSNGTNWFVV